MKNVWRRGSRLGRTKARHVSAEAEALHKDRHRQTLLALPFRPLYCILTEQALSFGQTRLHRGTTAAQRFELRNEELLQLRRTIRGHCLVLVACVLQHIISHDQINPSEFLFIIRCKLVLQQCVFINMKVLNITINQ